VIYLLNGYIGLFEFNGGIIYDLLKDGFIECFDIHIL
jgi:hypothetical protein